MYEGTGRAGLPVDYYCCVFMVEYGGGRGGLGRTEYRSKLGDGGGTWGARGCHTQGMT
jgi:hypothetical protein